MDERVREELKSFPITPLYGERRSELNKISGKAIRAIILFLVLFIIIGIRYGLETIGIFLGVWLFISALILILEFKDIFKLKKYDEIYIVKAYVERWVPVNHGRQVYIQYYDFVNGLIMPMKIKVERMDDNYNTVQNGNIILVLMGKRKGKLRFISLKPNNI